MSSPYITRHTLDVARYSAAEIAHNAKYVMLFSASTFAFGAVATRASMPTPERRSCLLLSGMYACAAMWTVYGMWEQAEYIEMRAKNACN